MTKALEICLKSQYDIFNNLEIQSHNLFQSLIPLDQIKCIGYSSLRRNESALNNGFLQTFQNQLGSDNSLQVDFGFSDKNENIIIPLQKFKNILTMVSKLVGDHNSINNKSSNLVDQLEEKLVILKNKIDMRTTNEQTPEFSLESDSLIKPFENERNVSDMDVFRQLLTCDDLIHKNLLNEQLVNNTNFILDENHKETHTQIYQKQKTNKDKKIKIEDLLNQVKNMKEQMESLETKLYYAKIEDSSSISFNITK